MASDRCIGVVADPAVAAPLELKGTTEEAEKHGGMK
jgi:hypothetical protein